MRYIIYILVVFLSSTQLVIAQDLTSGVAARFNLLLEEISIYEKTLSTSGGIWRGQHPLALKVFSEDDYQGQKNKYLDLSLIHI